MDQIKHTSQQDAEAEPAKQESDFWKEQEEEFISRFFDKLVPPVLLEDGCSTPLPSRADCDSFAAGLLHCDDVRPVDNQGATSYTVVSRAKNKIVQFRLRRLNETALSLAYQTYGEQVAPVEYIGNFSLPVYTAPIIPGQVHILQQFPENRFPLERQTRTVQDVARFVARGAFFPQPVTSYEADSWTCTARTLLQTISNNQRLRAIEPRFAQRATLLGSKLGLLDRLPPVLTNPDFAEINMMVDQSSGALTGVLDFDDAQIEAFGMSIFGVYESFFGYMKDGRWYWYDEPVIATDHGDGITGDTTTVCQLLHTRFWDAFWTVTAPAGFSKSEYEESIQVALEVGIVNRYFVRGLQDGYDEENDDHVRGVEWARGIWLGKDFLDLPSRSSG